MHNQRLWLHLAKVVASKLPPQGDIGVQTLKAAAETGDLQKLELYLKNIAEQSLDPRSLTLTRKTFGDDIVNIAKKLFPNAKLPV